VPPEPTVEHRYVDLGDVRLHYVEAGTGPLVVLLHGFPEFWYSWRFQIPALTQAGFRVVAPDMRGYNLSSKPKGVGSYRLDLLARDVERLIRALGEERAVVVGHDWGAIVAWAVAMLHPERVEKLAILNVPHPQRLSLALRTPRQLLKSSYVFFFQLPWLPEKAVTAGNFASLRTIFRNDPVRPGTFDERDIDRYVEAFSHPGALTAAINYYRALTRQTPSLARALSRTTIETPVLVIWGERDRFLVPELARPDPTLVPNARLERLPDASHWVQQDRPEKVNALLLDFLRSPQPEG
jgi:pimeloyl-ACP methyl ester carboxylesterase